jgi:Ca-activated chloride channel homolog
VEISMKKGNRFYTVISLVVVISLLMGCSKKETTDSASNLWKSEPKVETSTETSTESGTEIVFGETHDSTSSYEAKRETEEEKSTSLYFGETVKEEDASLNLSEYEMASLDSISTFSIDVDTASYSVVRNNLKNNFIPSASDIRLEELINYFQYDYPNPKKSILGGKEQPFSISTELVPCPWNSDFLIASIGINGKTIDLEQRPSTNLVFLMDVSGSMNDEDKLPLLKESFKLLVNELGENDRVSIVVYASASGVILKGARGDQKSKILDALDDLEAGGSTNGGEGIEVAYELAKDYFIKNGNNRVILATDGDFNVGVSSQEALMELIEVKRNDGIFLSALGFGQDGRNFETMELLADNGNGMFAYIDSEREARKVLIEQLGGTLYTIAKDVKIQVEFNPAVVAEYALIGYDNRRLEDHEFDDDSVDAGDIGAGHQVTALYMVRLNEGLLTSSTMRYQEKTLTGKEDELMYVKLRYKEPKDQKSQLIEKIIFNKVDEISNNVGFALCVAEFGLALRGDFPYSRGQYQELYDEAMTFILEKPDQYKIEFVSLIEKASNLVN